MCSTKIAHITIMFGFDGGVKDALPKQNSFSMMKFSCRVGYTIDIHLT